MRKEKWQKFLSTGKIEDYLAYKKAAKYDQEVALDNLKLGEQNDSKRGNNTKKYWL